MVKVNWPWYNWTFRVSSNSAFINDGLYSETEDW